MTASRKRFGDDEKLSMHDLARAAGVKYETVKRHRVDPARRHLFPPEDDTFLGRPFWLGRTVNEFLDRREAVNMKMTVTAGREGIEAWAREHGLEADPATVRAHLRETLESLVGGFEHVTFDIRVQ